MQVNTISFKNSNIHAKVTGKEGEEGEIVDLENDEKRGDIISSESEKNKFKRPDNVSHTGEF